MKWFSPYPENLLPLHTCIYNKLLRDRCVAFTPFVNLSFVLRLKTYRHSNGIWIQDFFSSTGLYCKHDWSDTNPLVYCTSWHSKIDTKVTLHGSLCHRERNGDLVICLLNNSRHNENDIIADSTNVFLHAMTTSRELGWFRLVLFHVTVTDPTSSRFCSGSLVSGFSELLKLAILGKPGINNLIIMNWRNKFGFSPPYLSSIWHNSWCEGIRPDITPHKSYRQYHRTLFLFPAHITQGLTNNLSIFIVISWHYRYFP